MSKRKNSPNKKLKQSLAHIIRKVFSKNPDSTLTHKQVCALIDVRESALRKLAFDVLEDLVKEGVLTKSGHSIYSKNRGSGNALSGVIQLTPRGAGYVILDDSTDSDVFIQPKNLNQALDGDRVKVQITKKGKSK